MEPEKGIPISLKALNKANKHRPVNDPETVHVGQEVQRLGPTAALLAGADGCIVGDSAELNLGGPEVTHQLQSCMPGPLLLLMLTKTPELP